CARGEYYYGSRDFDYW
nr:immunoglobulin heavy chain junction region [Mus musculus]MBK4185399.1 immunoglobulin heavy chain junction region [Mus musculus]MBK4189533.1 immunoglobulin heavy chain junction region [Mus musculus]MBK4189534.1 immunoglobulin heavy chain junction region [Mus musculus]MBK4189535.1 immunoglobulin heavy chain junction region [Mus musculus]